jgi:hypothetical protein
MRAMEITCSRCHQSIPDDGLYCPSCGLPQLVYPGDEALAPAQAGVWSDALSETGAVEWRPALRFALLLALPAGLLCGGVPVLGLLGFFWMAAAAAWAVALYSRSQRSVSGVGQSTGWLTAGAGARIGLVTGLVAGWIAFASSGVSLFIERFVFHGGKDFDDVWQTPMARVSEQWQSIGAAGQDPKAGEMAKAMVALLLSPEGKAGSMLGGTVAVEAVLVVFAIAGGALGAKLLAGPKGQQG